MRIPFIGALTLFTLLFLNLMTEPVHAKTRQLPKQEFNSPGCGGADIPMDLAIELALDHYHRYGIWAGVFTIDRVVQQRIEPLEKGVVLHMHYHYQPIPNNRFQRTDQGYDQRTFSLECDKGWRVIGMGSHFSARFP